MSWIPGNLYEWEYREYVQRRGVDGSALSSHRQGLSHFIMQLNLKYRLVGNSETSRYVRPMPKGDAPFA